MKFNIVELIRSAFVKRDKKFRQRLTVFFICLLISIFVWFTVKMDNEYQEIIPIPIKFANTPRSKVLVEASDSIIYVELSEKGSELLRYRFMNSQEPLVINTKNVILTNRNGESKGYILTSSLFDDVGYQHNLAGKVVSISPDTIYLTFKNEGSVKVPVTADLQIGTQKQFMVYGSVTYDPDSVTIMGPKDYLPEIKSASLGTIKFQDLKESTTVNLPIQLNNQNKFLIAEPKEVKVTIPVEKFTEASLEVPVSIIADSSLRIKLFPETVTINYLVALKDYSQVTAGMFHVVADFTGIDLQTEKKIKVKVEEAPPDIKITRIDPDKVEFIIIQ